MFVFPFLYTEKQTGSFKLPHHLKLKILKKQSSAKTQLKYEYLFSLIGLKRTFYVKWRISFDKMSLMHCLPLWIFKPNFVLF